MHMSRASYQDYVARKETPSPWGRNLVWAFVTGGLICMAGQGLTDWYRQLGLDADGSGTAVSVTLIAVTALLTGIGVFDGIAKHAGAGTLIPITGFANAVAAPAVEFKHEGLITGMAAKMFTVAGPVLVYGLSASVIYGILLWVL